LETAFAKFSSVHFLPLQSILLIFEKKKEKKKKKRKQSSVLFSAKNHTHVKFLPTEPSASMDQKGIKTLSEKERKKKKEKERRNK
jgi:hypothetical protein